MSREATINWKKGHPSAVHIISRRYRQNHRAEIRANALKSKRLHFESTLLAQARCRARKRGQPFAITLADIFIPELCPVFGIPLHREGRDGRSAPDFPTLDCLIPGQGYVPGNVFVISSRANRLKSDASWQELQMLAS